MIWDSNLGEQISGALDRFEIELPSWGFGNTGTRFGKFFDPTAAFTIEEKMRDAALVHGIMGCCPTVAVHVLWDCPDLKDAEGLVALAADVGIRIGSVNPNLFQNQKYKHGSLANPDSEVRQDAFNHCLESVDLAQRTGSRDISLWLADGSNYPGTANIRHRRNWLQAGLCAIHERLALDQRLLIEYKPFEPAFYHTDIADWGMALLLAREAGPQARVLVDTGHHYLGQNIEQIVAWLLQEKRLGGFHFNDRRYADDDLTLGSIDPYQVFRIFHEILLFERETAGHADIAFMIDQSHNLKPKIEAMVQTVATAQELFAKAVSVDHDQLVDCQNRGDLVGAEECLKRGFYRDVAPLIGKWRVANGLPVDPLRSLREGGYLEKIKEDRKGRQPETQSYA
jgi:L-rhamnose isomerase/sugar isomerase